jgi:hypothetical protein
MEWHLALQVLHQRPYRRQDAPAAGVDQVDGRRRASTSPPASYRWRSSACLLLARITPAANPWSDILPALTCNGVFLMTAMQTFRGLEPDEVFFANAQQLKNMLGQACVALGITLGMLGQQWRAAEHYATLGARVNPANPAFAATLQRLQEALTPSMGPAQAARIATAQLAQMLSQQSALLANIDHFLIIAALALLGVLVTLVQRVLR